MAVITDEQTHRIEAYRDLRQRLLNTRAREQWQLEQAQDRNQRQEALRRFARVAMVSEIIEELGDLAGL